MLDINLFREQPDLVRDALRKRQMDPEPVDQVLALDEQRRVTAVGKRLATEVVLLCAAHRGRALRGVAEERGDLGRDTVAARVDGQVYDLHTPIPEGAAEVAPIGAHDADALAIIRHSSAHVMADAVQRLFPGTKVAFGPEWAVGYTPVPDVTGDGNTA